MVRMMILAGLALTLLGAVPHPNNVTLEEQRNAATEIGNGVSGAPGDRPGVAREREAVQPAQSSEATERCERGEENRQSDLCAQWKAADAAYDAARWAMWSLVLAIIGTAALFATLYWTRKAVHVAMKATTDASTALAIAERNAQAATDQVAVARETALKQLRAYVGVSAANYTFQLHPDGTGGFGAGLEVLNSGQTPAYRFRHIGVLNLRGFPSDMPDPGLPEGNTHTLFQGMKTYINMGLPLNADQIAGLQNGVLGLFIQIVIEYEDYAGHRHVQTVRYIAHRTAFNMTFLETIAGTLTFHSGDGD
jgi:hypothetical protein